MKKIGIIGHSQDKLSFNDWLRVNYTPTTNKNLFTSDSGIFLRSELIEVYEKE
tara:strand:- start:990 stop:1148 length:159 start_codon:yes stop_codon:yes gene_type:complete